MSLDIHNGIKGRVNNLYWSKLATIIHNVYQSPICKASYELGTIMAFTPPEGTDLPNANSEKFCPLFTTSSGKTIFLRFHGVPSSHQVDYCNNLNSGDAATYSSYNVYCFDVDVCIGTYESYSIIQTVSSSGASYDVYSYYANLSSGGYSIAGDLTGHFEHTAFTLSYGAAYSTYKCYKPFYNESNYHGVIAVNDENNSKIDFYIINRGGSFVSGGDAGSPYWFNSDDPTCDLSPNFSISYTILEQYLTDEDTDLPAPGFESDVTTPGGGNNTPSYNNYPGDDVGFPDLPSSSILTSGLYGFYNPNAAGFTLFADWLWSDTFLDAAKRAFTTQPLDAIIYAGMLPFNLTTTPSTIEAAGINSNIPAGKITNQYYTLDFGYVTIPEKWKSVMDYKFTKTSIYIPFVGVRNIDHEVIMNATLRLKYLVDAITGDFVAMVTVTKSGYSESVYYTYNGNMLITLPLTGNDRSAMIQASLSTLGSAISNIGGGALSGGAIGGAPGAIAGAGVGAIRTVGQTISSANNFTKTDIKQSGNFNSSSGALGQFNAYVIVEQPVQSLPSKYGHTIGFTSNMTAVLSTLTGFTVVDKIHLNIQASDEELNEIYAKLQDGVIL